MLPEGAGAKADCTVYNAILQWLHDINPSVGSVEWVSGLEQSVGVRFSKELSSIFLPLSLLAYGRCLPTPTTSRCTASLQQRWSP
jgi:hypothetical protein